MRFLKKQLSLWRIVLIIGVAAIAIPIAVRVSPSAIAVVKERPDSLARQSTADNEGAYAKDSRESKAAVGEGVALLQDDYYDRRREYWEKRVERRLDEEDLDGQSGDEKAADSQDSNDSKAAKDKDSKDAAADDANPDDVDQEIERRRDYWRKRLDKEW